MKLRYNHNQHGYVAPLDDHRVLVVDDERFNYCLRYNETLDAPLYEINTWLPHVDGDQVRIEERQPCL